MDGTTNLLISSNVHYVHLGEDNNALNQLKTNTLMYSCPYYLQLACGTNLAVLREKFVCLDCCHAPLVPSVLRGHRCSTWALGTCAPLCPLPPPMGNQMGKRSSCWVTRTDPVETLQFNHSRLTIHKTARLATLHNTDYGT